MSLVMLALRVCAVEALKSANTLVGDNVLDSQISALSQGADGQLKTGQQNPFIAVYTDSSKFAGGSDPDTNLRGNGTVELLFNFGISATMGQTDKKTGDTEIFSGFLTTDADFEASLDVIDVQIRRALADGGSDWAQLYGALVSDYIAIDHRRSSAGADGARITAGQTKITVGVLPDPVEGCAPSSGSVWFRLVEKLRSTDHRQLGIFEKALGLPGSQEPASYEKLTSIITADLQALKLSPVQDGVPLQAPEISESGND